MAVKFSQFTGTTPNSNVYFAGYNSVLGTNVQVSYTDLAASISPGTGTTNYVSKWTGSTVLGDSQIFDNGTSVGIGTASPSASFKLDVSGFTRLSQNTDSATLTVTGNLNGVQRILLENTSATISAGAGFRFNNDTGLKAQLFLGSTVYTSGANTLFIDGVSSRVEIGSRTSNVDINTVNLGVANTKLRVFNNGNVGIGSNPTDAGFKLDVSGTFRSTLDANINGLTVGRGLGSVSNNTALGSIALNSNTSGDYNTAVGRESLTSNTTGAGNIGLGWASGRFQQTGNYNLYLGYGAGYYDRGSNNIFVGFQTGFHTTFSTSSNNLGVGHQALNVVDADYNIGVGFRAGNGITTGTYNTIVGSGTTANGITTGSYNTIIGSQITGLSSSLSNTIILSDGQGNQRLYVNSSGNVGIGTASPTSKITMFGTNPTFRVQGDGASYYGGIDFWSSVSGSNRKNGSITQYDANGLYVEAGTGMRLTFTTNNGTEGMRLTSAGRLLIGTTTESTYILDANGTVRVQGTELRLDNGTTGTINLYSATPSIQFAAGDPTGYRLYRSATNMILNSAGAIIQQIGGNNAYQIDATNGHLLRSAISGGAALARLTTGGNFMVGTTTDEASAVLQATSTTKGFLPPRMTGAQAELIGTPAAGLLVYANNGNGVTITSIGWWGYNGTTWVKLN